MFESAWSLSSLSQRPTLSKVAANERHREREREREVRGQSQVSMQNIKRIWREKRERYYEERLLLLCVVVLVGTPFFSSVTLLVSFLFLPCLVMSYTSSAPTAPL